MPVPARCLCVIKSYGAFSEWSSCYLSILRNVAHCKAMTKGDRI